MGTHIQQTVMYCGLILVYRCLVYTASLILLYTYANKQFMAMSPPPID